METSSGDGISTHILTKRMTTFDENGNGTQYISTHILTKRMTLECQYMDECANISTHILTKRMTSTVSSKYATKEDFNSHPHEEDDMAILVIRIIFTIFQLTSSRRG